MFRSTSLHRFALVGALALAAVACGKDEGATGTAAAVAQIAADSPDAAVMQSVQMLRNSDFNALIAASVPPAQLEAAKANWMSELKDEEITDEKRAEFAAMMAQLTGPDAEAQMLAQIRPQLEQFQGEMAAQLPAMVAMGKGFALSAINENAEIKAENKVQATNVVNAFAAWAEKGEFTDIGRAERAIAEITKAARALPVKTLDEVHALDFNGLMNVVGVGYGGVKGALAAYGIDIDQTLASVSAETLSQEGDTANVRVKFDFLGAPIEYDTQLVRIDGRWYGKDTVEQLNKPQTEDGA